MYYNKMTRDELISEIDILQQKLMELKEGELENKHIEEELAAIYEHIPTAIIIMDKERHVLKANKVATEFAGFSEGELIGLRGGEALRCLNSLDDPAGCGFGENCKICPVRQTILDTFDKRTAHVNIEAELPIHRKGKAIKAGLLFSVVPIAIGSKERVLVSVQDITDEKSANRQQGLMGQVLEVINESMDEYDVIRNILLLIKDFTGVEAAGIRLREGIDYPYYEVNGFPKDFVEAERYLCARDRSGKPILDTDGNPMLECMCGNIIRGRFDPSFPFFTEGGSFWSNCTTRLLASTTEKDRQARTRNRCNADGYESVALIPLRSEEEIIGLLQLNDTCENMFTTQLIAFLEKVGASIGISLARKWAKDRLKVKENYYRSLISNLHEEIVVIDSEYRICDINDTFLNNHGSEREGILGRYCHEITHGYKEPCHNHGEECKLIEVFASGEPANCMHEHLTCDNSKTWVDILLSPMKDEKGKVTHVIEAARNVNDLFQTTEALKMSEMKWRSLVENAPSIILIVDREGTIGFINRVMSGISESVEDTIGTTVYDYTAPKDHNLIRNTITQVFRTGEPSRYEVSVDTNLNGKMWFETQVGPIREDDKIVAVILITTDITERKQSESDLAESEGMLRTIFNNAMDGILLASSRTQRFFAANRSFCRLTGYTEDELKGMSVEDIHPAESLQYVNEQFAKQAKGEITLAENIPIKKKDGSIHYSDVNSTPIRLGSRKYLMGIFRDITERKAAEQERQKLLFDATKRAKEITCLYSVVSLLSSPERKLDEILEEVVELIPPGWQYPEETGAKIVFEGKIFKSKNYRDTPWNIQADISVSGRWVGIVEVIYLGQNPLAEEGPFLDEEIELLNMLASEITKTSERKQLENQLQQSMKMEAIGRLAGGVAHDFNNLLTGILGYSELLLSSIEGQSQTYNDILEIRKAGETAASLTKQLLAFSRKQVFEPEVVNLNSTIKRVEKMLKRVIGEDLELTTTLELNLDNVLVDPGQVEQIIMNLAINGRDAMPNGGKIIIETSNIELDEEYTATHLGAKTGKYVMLAISDTGEGMDEETRAHIFEPFFTTKEKGRGTGLGLSTVYGIVKQSGGYIWVYSELGKGTTFKIYFPRAVQLPQSTKHRSLESGIFKGIETVLLVEDENMVRELAKRILENNGYTVLEAADGNEATVVYGKNMDRIDLVITDVIMPGMSGDELAERILETNKDLKVLFMSGYTEDTIVHRGALDPGRLLLQKPFTPKSLIQKVREVLDNP
jgi:PAS domain S-box-containing protein